jgi:hypothetical protein
VRDIEVFGAIGIEQPDITRNLHIPFEESRAAGASSMNSRTALANSNYAVAIAPVFTPNAGAAGRAIAESSDSVRFRAFPRYSCALRDSVDAEPAFTSTCDACPRIIGEPLDAIAAFAYAYNSNAGAICLTPDSIAGCADTKQSFRLGRPPLYAPPFGR